VGGGGGGGKEKEAVLSQLSYIFQTKSKL